MPLMLTVFRNVPGRGYFFSKTFGILAVSYLTWLGGAVGLWRFSIGSIAISIGFLAGTSGYFCMRDRGGLIGFFRSNLAHILTVELFFLASFAFFSLLKGYNPEIIPPTERFMDFALLKNILRGGSFPLNDPWYTGEPINYYHFGHLMAGALNLLSGLPPEVFFNVAVALVFALMTTGSFSLGLSMTRRTGYGFLTSGFVFLLGNLDGFLQVVQSGSLHPFNWFGSSRIIPGTINEFPFFSFLWGEMHAYVLAFPLVVMVLALGYNLLMSEKHGIGVLGERYPDRVLHLGVLGLSLGSLLVVHSWDFPTYAFIVIWAILLQQLSTSQQALRWNLVRGCVVAGTVIAMSIVFCAPYFGSFDQKRQIGLIADKSTLNEFFTIFGLFLFVLLSLLVERIRRIKGDAASASLILFVATSAFIISRQYVFIFLGLLLPAAVYLFLRNLKDKSCAYVLLLFTTGVALGLAGEFFYVKDHFGPPYQRMNTIFKVYLQIWVCWACASAFSIYLIWESLMLARRRLLRWVWMSLLIALIGASLIYPFASTYSRTNKFQNRPSLDGLAALRTFSPPDYEAVAWINANIRGTPVILETTGGPYTWNARVSSFTGLPTVLGWGNHEAGWRNSWKGVMERSNDIQIMYSTLNMDEARRLMGKYDVEYVYIGSLERGKYSPEGLEKFSRFMIPVYDSHSVLIFRTSPH